MIKVIKFRIISLLEDKFFIFLSAAFFIILNYNVFINSGILSTGGSYFNQELKATLLINNFILASTAYGLLVPIYMGMGVIGKDINSGQIYILLSSFPKRYKYYWGNWIGLVSMIVINMALLLINFFAASLVLEVVSNYKEVLLCFVRILFNMIILVTLTFAASTFLKDLKSAVVGIFALGIFNVYAFLKLPFLNISISMSENIRRILANIVPIMNVNVESIYNQNIVLYRDIKPFLISDKFIYQIIYIIIILIIGNLVFGRKDIA